MMEICERVQQYVENCTAGDKVTKVYMLQQKKMETADSMLKKIQITAGKLINLSKYKNSRNSLMVK